MELLLICVLGVVLGSLLADGIIKAYDSFKAARLYREENNWRVSVGMPKLNKESTQYTKL